MALSYLDALSPAVRQAYPLIVGGVRQGLSANRIIGIARETFGSAGRRSTLLEVIARERVVWDKAQRFRFLPLDLRPRESSFAEALTKIRREYSFTVELKGFLTATGASWTQHVTVSSSKNLTRREAQDLALNAATEDGGRYGATVESALLISGLRAGRSGTFS